MLIRDGDRTCFVQFNGKEKEYSVTLYYGEKGIKEFTIDERDWNGESNVFRSFLINNKMGDLWKLINEDYTDPLPYILQHVSKAVNYGVKSGVDIYIGDDVFRVKEKDYIASLNFQIWYIATKKRIAAIPKGEWSAFVRECLKMSEQQKHDPLEPDFVEPLFELMRQSEIHSQFCDTIHEYVRSGSQGIWFVLDVDEKSLYVPKSVTTFLLQREKISRKRARQLLAPFLKSQVDFLMYIGIHAKPRLRGRFWVLDFNAIVDYDMDLAEEVVKKMIKCEEEVNEEVDVNVLYNGTGKTN